MSSSSSAALSAPSTAVSQERESESTREGQERWKVLVKDERKKSAERLVRSKRKKRSLSLQPATMRLARSSSCSLASSSRPRRLAPAITPRYPAADRPRRSLAVASAQQQASDARGAIDAGIDLLQAGDARAALEEFGRALTLPGTGLKRYRCVCVCARIAKKQKRREQGEGRKKHEG